MKKRTDLEIATRCHDIQIGIGRKDVVDYTLIPKIGMLVSLSLHFRGLPILKYEVAKVVANHFLNIPSYCFDELIKILADIEFVILNTEGDTIKTILPDIPYFDDVYGKIGEFARGNRFNEHEELAIEILDKLTNAPEHRSNLFALGAEQAITNRTIHIGSECGYLLETRARGKDIVYSPLFFTENAEIFNDTVAKSGASSVKKVIDLLHQSQGWPLKLILQTKEINGCSVTDNEINLLKKLAQDGAVKPPTISTSHQGMNSFLFTPAPGGSRLHPSKKHIYEKAMALVAAVRQGQLLPKKYAIRSPYAILKSLKDTKYLRANSEANEQYRALVPLRVGYIEDAGSGMYRFRLQDTAENNEALDIAIHLVSEGLPLGTEIDDQARIAMQNDQVYIESLLASSRLRENEKIALSQQQQMELDNIFLMGGTDI